MNKMEATDDNPMAIVDEALRDAMNTLKDGISEFEAKSPSTPSGERSRIW